MNFLHFILRNIHIITGDYKLPKGATLFIMFYSLHRDPRLWSHPNEFHPDHFLPEECARRPKGSYLPFSWGPRSCPGIKIYNDLDWLYFSILSVLNLFYINYKYNTIFFKEVSTQWHL